MQHLIRLGGENDLDPFCHQVSSMHPVPRGIRPLSIQTSPLAVMRLGIERQNTRNTFAVFQNIIQQAKKRSRFAKSHTRIKRKILSSLLLQQISGRDEKSTAMYYLDWNPREFVQQRQYTTMPEDALETAITFTGAEDCAQATTTAAYLNEVWPATSAQTLRVLQRLVYQQSSCSRKSDRKIPVISHFFGPEQTPSFGDDEEHRMETQ